MTERHPPLKRITALEAKDYSTCEHSAAASGDLLICRHPEPVTPPPIDCPKWAAAWGNG